MEDYSQIMIEGEDNSTTRLVDRSHQATKRCADFLVDQARLKFDFEKDGHLSCSSSRGALIILYYLVFFFWAPTGSVLALSTVIVYFK